MRTPPRDCEMKSPDMFKTDTFQVFSVRTGDFLHYSGRDAFWQIMLDTEQTAPETPEVIDTAQLMMEL